MFHQGLSVVVIPNPFRPPVFRVCSVKLPLDLCHATEGSLYCTDSPSEIPQIQHLSPIADLSRFGRAVASCPYAHTALTVCQAIHAQQCELSIPALSRYTVAAWRVPCSSKPPREKLSTCGEYLCLSPVASLP